MDTDKTYNGWSSWEVWEFFNYYGDEIQEGMESLLEESSVTKSELREWLRNEVEIEIESIADSLYSTVVDEFTKSIINETFETIKKASDEIADSFYGEMLELCDEDEEDEEETFD